MKMNFNPTREIKNCQNNVNENDTEVSNSKNTN